MKKLRYRYNCISPDCRRELAFIDEHMRKVTRQTVLKYIDLDDLKELERYFGYTNKFPMSEDYHISYFKSKREKGQVVYGFVWSSQDYIFY